MIDLEKIGQFLRELREQHNLSQTELGRKVYVTRQAVSQWELGKCFPELQSAIAIAELYGITIADIYAGEIVNNKEKYNSVIEFVIKSEMKRMKKIITILVTLISVLLLLFLSYYFFNVYNKISVYTINTIQDSYQVNGIITKSVDDLYVNFELNDKVDNMCLVYNDIRLNCVKNTNYLVIKEAIGYNEQLPELSKIKINNFINNLYVEINNEQKIKLNITQDYKNNKVVFTKDSKNANYKNGFNIDESNVPEKVKKNFQRNSNAPTYTIIDGKTKIIYDIETKKVEAYHEKQDYTEYWIYDYNEKILLYYSRHDISTGKIIYEENNPSDLENSKKLFELDYISKYVD